MPNVSNLKQDWRGGMSPEGKQTYLCLRRRRDWKCVQTFVTFSGNMKRSVLKLLLKKSVERGGTHAVFWRSEKSFLRTV